MHKALVCSQLRGRSVTRVARSSCRLRRKIFLAAAVLAALHGSSASALSFTFSQDGFGSGASVVGGFAGEDLNFDGRLSSFDGEITAFNMSFFSGFVPPGDRLGSHFVGLSNVNGLVYDLGGGLLGDGTGSNSEGLSVFAINGLFQYNTGLRLNFQAGGVAQNFQTNAFDSTQQIVAVTAIPEPSLAVLLALGLVGLATSRKA